jgi:hypothetical protein
MTARLRVVRQTLLRRILPGLCVTAACITPRADAAVNCGDHFKVTSVATSFDGGSFETVLLTSRTIALEVETFAQWRPDEEGNSPAALDLRHASLKGVHVTLCPLSPPDLPNNVDAWKKYQADVAAAQGEGTVVSDQVDTTAGDGIRVLGWDTREARFTTQSPTGEVPTIQHHFVLLNGQTGLRIILTAPSPMFERAMDDLRFWLSRVSPPGAHAN